MNEAATYILKRRLAQFFSENLKDGEVVEAYVEDLAHYLKCTPQFLVNTVKHRRDRREIEAIALESGYRLVLSYRPGVIFCYRK